MNPERDAEITRRTLIGGAAAAGAASLLPPSSSIASALDTHPELFSRWVGSVDGESRVVATGRRFSLVGVQWAGPQRPRIELRTRASGGAWSRWAAASVLGHGPDRPSVEGARFGEPIWTGSADAVQLRTRGLVHGLRLHLVGGAITEATTASAALPLANPGLDAGPGQPRIVARVAWARGQAPPRFPAAYGSVRLAFVHHSETPNGYSQGEVPAILRSIFVFHRYVRGWNDIGYNFAIDAFGTIWEARAGGVDEPVIGAQAGGYNLVSTGVVMLGTFIGSLPSPAALRSLPQLLAWKLSLHGVPALGRVTVEVDPSGAGFTRFAPGAQVSLPRVAGHRDGDTTACPGDALYARLPSIRPRVAALAGTPAKLTIAAEPAVVPTGGSVTLSGRLALLGGAPLAGAPIELQSVAVSGAQTIATAVTAADGSWSASLAPATNVLVRALHRSAPAAVSDVALLGVQPVVTLQLVGVSPLRVSGTISAPKRSVTVDLYARANGHRRLVASKRVAVRDGLFAATIRTRRHGPSVLVARTLADRSNVAGESPPVDVTL